MNHRTPLYLLIGLLLPMLLIACDKEKDIYGILYLDMVTVHVSEEDAPHFTRQANDASAVDTLYPTPALSPEGIQEGQRVMLQYNPVGELSNHRQIIQVQVLLPIHFDTLEIAPKEIIDKLPDDTVYLQSVWKTGDFLNLRYRVEYNNSPHSVFLVADENELSGDTLKLQLRHSRNDDPVGHWRNLYSSFNIAAYRSRPYTTIQLYVNQVNFKHKYYYFNLD